MLVFKNAFLLDGTGQEPVVGATVVLEGGKIFQVGKGIPIPGEAQVIDLKGKPLLPGFSDAHTHLGGSANPERPGLHGRFDTYDYAVNREAYLNWGITTVRSGGDFTPEILAFRDEINEGKFRSPRIISPGPLLQAQGGHPGFTVWLANQKSLDNATVLIDEQTDIEAEVKKLVEAGVDLIKAAYTDDHPYQYQVPVPRLSKEQLKRIADAAHQYGKRLMVHISDLREMADAAASGADTIEHTINIGRANHEVTDDLLKALTSREIWIVPTMTVPKIYDGFEGRPLVYPALEKAVRKFIEAGVKIGVGTDAGAPFIHYGEGVHLEMELLTSVGMSPLAVITAATGGNAKMFGKTDIFGTIEPGKAADLVVLGANPLENIRNTREIKMVLRDGRIVVDKLMND